MTLDDATIDDLLGVPGRGRRHGVELPRPGRGGGGEGLVLRALHRSRQPLFPYAEGRRQGVADAADAGGPGARRSSASSTSRPTRRRRAAAPSGCSGTLQDRLPKELRLAGITSVEAANRWLAEVYLPEHNARFAVPAEQDGSAFVADAAQAWREILCIQEERVVGNDNTVNWKRLSLQIPPSPLRPHFVRAKVRVHEYPDGRLARLPRARTGSPTTTPQADPSNAHALAA